MRGNRLSVGLRAILAIFTVTLFMTNTWGETQEKVLYSFNFYDAGGTEPWAGLIFDAAGNLYGTTNEGGAYGGSGTVFELTPVAGGGWAETVLHSFQFNGTDGVHPVAGVIFDAAGNLYGTTPYGGTYWGAGTVFELTPTGNGDWTEKVLHNFNFTDGAGSEAGLIFDAAGNLYGTTSQGGAYGYGTVFELTPTGNGDWTEQVLYNFCLQSHCTDGQGPGGLIFDAAGNLYGTTSQGGAYSSGTVFELTPTVGGGWTEKILHSFNGTDEYNPTPGVIFDAAGNLYGMTSGGGTYDKGTVFELTRSPHVAGGGWTEKVLHCFNGADGAHPSYGVLISDAAGNLYGTAGGGTYDAGTVFELTRSPHVAGGGWTEKVLHNFNPYDGDADNPYAGLIFDTAGNLYSTTWGGGTHGSGAVFEITP